jgi:DNA modification methylase
VSVFLRDADCTLYHGDVLDVLRELPSESVHCVATSPPFYGLRDYDVDGQIGLEDTPYEWAARLVEVFAECRRVLRDDGTLWIECGDSYCANTGRVLEGGERVSTEDGGSWRPAAWSGGSITPRPHPTKPKDLLGSPWLLAFALRADGWWLRGCNIWAKPNAMPESAQDRCTTAHSYVFHLSKQARYWFDADAIAEPAKWERWGDQTTPKHEGTDTAAGWIKPKTKNELAREFDHRRPVGQRWKEKEFTRSRENREAIDGVRGFSSGTPNYVHPNGKRPRSVWTIPTQGYPEAHFATWPEKLAARIILAACPPGGTVLDPFVGSGTTCKVARDHGRHSVGIDLNADYLELAAKRLQQLSLLSAPAPVPATPLEGAERSATP